MPYVITSDEVIALFNAMRPGDKEEQHGDADAYLLMFLESNGFADIAAAYIAARDRIGFWCLATE